MRLKKTLVALAVVASTALTGCGGSNLDVDRGETDCDGGNNNTHDENCQEGGTPTPANNT